MMIIRTFTGLILLICVCFTCAKSQTNNSFTTYTGGFTINLPESANGVNGMGSGIRFSWRQSEAEYEIGFHERQGLPLAKKDGSFSLDEVVRRYFNKFSTGKQIYKKEISSAGKAGFEYKYETAQAIFLLRLFEEGDDLYQLQAEIPLKNQAQEEKVLQVFDSFRLLAKDVIKAETAKKITEATPKDLPQTPVVSKMKTDIQDRNLKGKVKTVLKESAHFAVNDSLLRKKPTLSEEFDEKGNLLKSIEYSSFGDPTNIRVYGYVAGKRVARIGSIPREYSLGGITLDFPGSSKPDNRFDESYTYKYLGGKLVEETTSWSNGMLFSRAKYTYLKNKKESFYFDGGTKPFQKVVTELNEQGDEAKITVFESDGRKFTALEPFVIKYDSYDEQGNWTQRTTSRFYGLEGQGKFFPESIEYRKILYY